MSLYGFRVYGEGHLAETMRAAIELRGLDLVGLIGSDVFAFVAPDVLDHSNQVQIAGVEVEFAQASSNHQFVSVVSQVPPGTTRRLAAGRSGVYYQVDTIIVRRAVERMVRPEQIIVGCADPAEPLPLAYQEYLATHECPVLQMLYESAELAKCAINYHLAAQVRTANELARAADRVGAEYKQVAWALAGDARIGPHAYLRPGRTNQHLDRDVSTISGILATLPDEQRE